VQRVLLQIVQSLGSLCDAERLHVWVYRTARNVVVDYYRSKGGRSELTTADTDRALSEPASIWRGTPPTHRAIADDSGLPSTVIPARQRIGWLTISVKRIRREQADDAVERALEPWKDGTISYGCSKALRPPSTQVVDARKCDLSQ
jgi:DNA-directed RNA polymerase specialized sigma24 family protein